MKTFLSIALTLLISALGSEQAVYGSTSEIVLAADVEWTPLNPLRGDKGPQAATLWGDRNGRGPTGFLVKFVDGFASPPHIHNVTYRGVVIDGLVHNDDPAAAEMWMPAGSFWTQPAGEVHVTAAKGGSSVTYIEIDQAPYLVLPPEEAFDRGERPINVHASNIVWIDPPGVPASGEGPKVAFLWGDPQDSQPNGKLLKLPAGFSGELVGTHTPLRAVVIEGRIRHLVTGGSRVQTLEPGSYFGSKGETVHRLTCESKDACLLYMRTKGAFDVVPVQPKK